MTTAQRNIHTALETRDRLNQVALEAAALRGELGIDAQLLAMSELYKQLKSEGKLAEAAAIRAEAMIINATRS